MISSNLRIVAIAGSLALLVFVVELVRRRHLKEEYSVLWVATALALLLLAAWEGLLHNLAHFIGADSQASTLYFFGLLFVVFLLLHFSVRVSKLERRVIVLLQEIALLGERDERPPAHGVKLAAGRRDGRMTTPGGGLGAGPATGRRDGRMTAPGAGLGAGLAPEESAWETSVR
jgi:hypothetical protein